MTLSTPETRNQTALAHAVAAIRQAQTVLVAGHVNPDGDSLGCTLAVVHALKALGKDVTALAQDGVPDAYTWLPGAGWIQRETERRGFELAVVVDSGNITRVGPKVAQAIESAAVVMDIDHHVADGPFGDIQVLDEKAAATAELIYELLLALEADTGATLRTREIAECLMTGLVTDTGSFRFPNTTPRTFMFAAELQRLGAVPSAVNENVYECKSFASQKVLGRALATLQTTPDGRVAWARVSAADFSETGADDADTEGIVNHVRSVRGVQIALLFREIPGKKVRVSLRAREGADVSRVAAAFGGGGHRLAAGCSLEPPLAAVETQVVAEAVRQLSSFPQN